MGLGKTASTLTALAALGLAERVFPALVLAPLRVANSTWPEEVRKWAPHLAVETVTGTVKERRRALEHEADVYTTNYENLEWLVEELDGAWPFHTIVADESTRLKGFRGRNGGKRARALGKVAYKSERFVGLTGTPAPNGLIDLWGQSWFIDPRILGDSFTAFRDRWFAPVRLGSDPFAVRWEPLGHAQKEIEARLSSLCLSIRTEDWFPVDQPIVNDIEVDLPPSAMRAYEAMEDELFAELENGASIEAMGAAARCSKCLQIASGAVYDETGAWHEVHQAKVEALRSVVEESAGAPVLVAYQYRHELERILKSIPGAKHLDKDPETIKRWNKGLIPVLVAHPASCGHGLNLQDGGSTLVFTSMGWDLEQYQQIIERIGPARQAQAGHPRPVTVHRIMARNTLDRVVAMRMEGKRDVQDLLLEALKCKSGR